MNKALSLLIFLCSLDASFSVYAGEVEIFCQLRSNPTKEISYLRLDSIMVRKRELDPDKPDEYYAHVKGYDYAYVGSHLPTPEKPFVADPKPQQLLRLEEGYGGAKLTLMDGDKSIEYGCPGVQPKTKPKSKK
jgi:hypothetical protein